MSRICYRPTNFKDATLAIISAANRIIQEYTDAGFVLTLRQLYYQFVARDLIANKQSEYKRLGSIINKARYAGLVDWEAMEDRTRNLRDLSSWTGPEHLIEAAATWFHRDHWVGQPTRVEVWIEKDALVGVIEPVCQRLDIPFFSCRGYVSSSEMWSAGNRLHGYRQNHGQRPIILHLGDHDPSGVNMTEVIQETLDVFDTDVLVQRIALTMDQVEEHDPPPNPAKETDSRYDRYVEQTGLTDCWELDALDPRTMEAVIQAGVDEHIDQDTWDDIEQEENREREQLEKVADGWSEIVDRLDLDLI